MHETNCKGLFLQSDSSLKAAKDWEAVVCLSWSCNNYEHQRDALTKTVNTILHYITRGVLGRHKEVFMPLCKCQQYLLQYIGYGSTEYLRKRNFIWNMCREGSQKKSPWARPSLICYHMYLFQGLNSSLFALLKAPSAVSYMKSFFLF